MTIRDTTLRGRASSQGAPEAGLAAPEGAPLDLAHLARQCLGDRDLAAVLLREFGTQAQRIAAQLAEDDRLSSAAQADIAHRLRGSALAVGARAVAHAAGIVEACGRAAAHAAPEAGSRPDEMSQAIATLIEAVSQATAEIARIQADPPDRR